jgi:hypothetical protein
VQVTDTGAIDRMSAKNNEELSVFLRSGTIFKGPTQERASQRSTIILPGEAVDIKVRCIHATRGIKSGSHVKYGGSVPLTFEQAVYTQGFNTTDQSKYWASAATVNSHMRSFMNVTKEATARGQALQNTQALFNDRSSITGAYYSGTVGGYTHAMRMEPETIRNAFGLGSDDLSSTYDTFSNEFDDVIRKVKLVDDQVGLAMISDGGCQTIEIFDAHTSWKALHEDAIKRLGPSVAHKDEDNVFEYKPEKAQEVVKKVLAMDFKENLIYNHKPNNGDPAFAVYGLTADQYTGEVVEFDGKVIHLMLIKMKN